MRYVISESQSNSLEDKIKIVLENYFFDLDSLCGFNVYLNDEEEQQSSGAIFDIYAIIKTSYSKRFNELGRINLQKQIKRKVEDFIRTHIPVECFVGTISEDC